MPTAGRVAIIGQPARSTFDSVAGHMTHPAFFDGPKLANAVFIIPKPYSTSARLALTISKQCGQGGGPSCLSSGLLT